MDFIVTTVLLVEDNPNDLELALLALDSGKSGNRVDVARDGAEALDYLFRRGAYAERDPAQEPRVVLLDLDLPLVGGIDVLRAIKTDQRTQHLPVVVLTSSAEDRDLAACYALGVDSYIVKPLDDDSFVEAIREVGLYRLLLNRPRPSRTPVGSQLHVLVLEDSAVDAELLAAELAVAGFDARWSRVHDAAGFRAGLDGQPDIIIADYRLPGFDALAALALVREHAPEVPVIVVSGVMSEEACVQCLRLGAVDYLLKDRLVRLGPAVRHALAQRRLEAARRKAERAAQEAVVILRRQARELAIANVALQKLDVAKNRFVAAFSHELRAPLTSIRGYAEILAGDEQLPVAGQRMIGIIDCNSRRLLDLIEDLFAFARLETDEVPPDPAPAGVAELVERCRTTVEPASWAAGS